ncbi:hypothetical protein [Tistlia consotensis]|uniref:hypothetical protein n=1 Tax=Tistlia consotensis TaxID=1321365 RepID=UPI00117C2C58|nr:hypothetical protein [Tistlia consotensis]
MSNEASPHNQHLTRDCLDEWLGNFSEFKYYFLRHCQIMAKAVGYYFDFDESALKVAHDNWRSRCELWESEWVMSDSSGLSHLKMMAILLYQLATVDWVNDIYEYDPSADGIIFNGSDSEKAEARLDLNAGRGTYLAFHFTIHVINWFESVRDDRKDIFVFRMTPELFHDLMVYLLSPRREEMAIFLALKCLYARD